MALPKLHKMSEVIDALGVSRQTVRGLVDSGELPAVKVGQQWRFRADDVEQLLRNRQASGLRIVGKDVA